MRRLVSGRIPRRRYLDDPGASTDGAAERRGATARVWRSGARARWADVAPAQTGRGPAPAAGREPGDGVALARGDGGDAEWLARRLPLRRRGEPREPGHRRRGAGERAAEGAAGRDAARTGAARSQDRPVGGASRPFGPTDAEAMSRTVSPGRRKPYGM